METLSLSQQSGKLAIYALVDPRWPDVVRYVGLAKIPRIRHLQHCGELSTSPKGVWIETMRDQGVLPQLVVLEWCEANWGSQRERHWIAHFDSRQLTNGSAVKRRLAANRRKAQALVPVPGPLRDFPVFERVKLEQISLMLERCGGCKAEAAKRLGIGRQTLYNKLQKINGAKGLVVG